MSSKAPIGVFDSGVGGLSVLRALRAELPHEDFVYLADSGFAPYGERGDAHVITRTRTVTERLLQEHQVKALVMACNTATAAAIDLMRAAYPHLPLVGVEPALKPAVALSKTRRIGVIGTRGTLGSAKVRALHESLKDQAEFILVPCDGLADAIQNDDASQIAELCARYMQALGSFGNEEGQIDTLVLGCTHYPFAQQQLAAHAGENVTMIETGEPVARQTRRLLQAADLLKAQGQGQVALLTTGSPQVLEAAARRWLGI
ncbi:MAG: glutamate racemase [Polaromonas sp.]|uniref:glutamate racemase n=1 Tax=Polaromonas sp. TaxID=1869339 RepID=UPI0027301AE6|nr:glutamate racemase [Polaromonas sp.]MDP1741273.1 glutamate racemase [Polaromonas sp.]MDP1956224.1 glutamate racemase [Polaromonas sp.]MDP3354915.1 glutamate racemase [Polaromonas sp.]MDP3750278.1 glutamate racemase [Polaromonas sp.]